MNVKQFRYSADNFGYLVYGEQKALAIDGGAVDEILAFISSKGLELEWTANTHSHRDHTVGTAHLRDRSNAAHLDYNRLVKNGGVEVEGMAIRVYHTPGHTDDSLTFHCGNVLITGDTLFNGTVGNCFTHDLKSFYRSITLLMGFPPETVVYAGHDYVKDAMVFAEFVEPENTAIDRFLKRYDPNHVFSTMEDEFQINPYLRFNEKPVIFFLEKRGLPVETEYQRWESLMSID